MREVWGVSSQWGPDTELGAAAAGLPRLSGWCCLLWEGTPRPAGQRVERKTLKSRLSAGRSLHAETLPSCSSLSSLHTQNPLPPRVHPLQDLQGKGSLVWGFSRSKTGSSGSLSYGAIMASNPITSWQIDGGKSGNNEISYFLELKIHCEL